MTRHNNTNTIIIGAGAAGLACAVCLKKSGLPFLLLEAGAGIGDVWRKRYNRLHLHTTKANSRLPYFDMPKHYPKYVSKDELAEHLVKYAGTFGINPRFNQKVIEASRGEKGWQVRTETGMISAPHLIIATGMAAKSRQCTWKGLENFEGKFLHSSQYTSGKDLNNKNVLVVGFGNSACEITLCLYENGAKPALSVRNCVNILPRDIAGISIVNIALLENWLTKISPALVDAVNKPLLRLINGNIEKYELRKCKYGPLTQIIRNRKIPLLDVGTIDLIRRGKVKVYSGIEEIGNNYVRFTDGREERFDAIICATGYDPSFGEFLRDRKKVCDRNGLPLISGKESALPGLFFCGFNVTPTGMLREIGIEARNIARSILQNNSIRTPVTNAMGSDPTHH